MGLKFYEDFYGVKLNGELIPDFVPPEEEKEDEGEDEEVKESLDGSSYSSRAPLIAVIKSLAKGKFNRTLATMVCQNSHHKLELNLASSNNLCRAIYSITAAYKQDFDKEEKKDESHKVVHPPSLLGLGVG